MEPSASLSAQNLKNAIAFSEMSMLKWLLVNAVKQLTQSVNVAWTRVRVRVRVSSK